jgi:hypothetical protein
MISKTKNHKLIKVRAIFHLEFTVQVIQSIVKLLLHIKKLFRTILTWTLKIAILPRKFKTLNQKIKKGNNLLKFQHWTLKRYRNNTSLICNRRSSWINNKIKKNSRVILKRARCPNMMTMNLQRICKKCRILLEKLWIKNNRINKSTSIKVNSISKSICKHFRIKKKEKI